MHFLSREEFDKKYAKVVQTVRFKLYTVKNNTLSDILLLLNNITINSDIPNAQLEEPQSDAKILSENMNRAQLKQVKNMKEYLLCKNSSTVVEFSGTSKNVKRT